MDELITFMRDKTHLGRLYQKTGTRRQVDLVKLMAGFATPLLG